MTASLHHGSRTIDWPSLIAIGIGVYRLPPDQFWNLTPREFAALRHALAPQDPTHSRMPRTRFEDLCADWPDTPIGDPST